MMRLFKFMLVLGIWGALFVGGVVLWFAKDLPDITQSATFERRVSLVVKASDGETLARYGESKGKNITVKSVPDHLVKAVVAIEDRRFYDHFGIDLIGITRAMVTNLYKGRFVQGGSTLTQQLAKNLFLTHDRTMSRKIKEAILAVWLEQELTKDEILSAYMNRVYLGSGTYGFDAAAQLYFGKPASDVNLREAAVLAGLLKAPSKYSPHNNPDLAKERSDLVLAAMVDAGFLKKSELAKVEKAVALPHKKPDNAQNVKFFTDWVIEGIDDLVGTPDIDMVIETTLDSSLQNHAQNSLVNAIDNAPADKHVTQGAIISLLPDGAVVAMVGGYDYNKSQFNRAIQALRPPGSSFKPFVYLAALRQGWSPQDIILDAPITEGKYRPKNYSGQYFGQVSLETALAKSMNTATVRLAQSVGIGNVLKTAKDLGIVTTLNRDLSVSLGSDGIPMLQMATAYATMANGGLRVYPYAITRITDGQNGRVLYERKAPQSYQRAIDSSAVYDISAMMRTVIEEGTGRGAKIPFPASGKTGTSQDSRDAWFAGYTNKLISVVWIGNDDNSPMNGVTGGSIPAKIWQEVMTYGHPRQSNSNMPSSGYNGSSNNNSISGLLGRLISGGSSSSSHKPDNARDPYKNLNE